MGFVYSVICVSLKSFSAEKWSRKYGGNPTAFSALTPRLLEESHPERSEGSRRLLAEPRFPSPYFLTIFYLRFHNFAKSHITLQISFCIRESNEFVGMARFV